MNNIDLSKPEKVAIAQDSLILKFSVIGCIGLGLIGGLVFTLNQFGYVAKTIPDDDVKRGDGRRELTTPTQPSEQSPIIIKQPSKPIVIEEGSEAWFCLQNNGGSNCLTRDRFAPNYKVVSPPRPQKTYEDYLVQYGVKSEGDCGRYFNGRPNC